MADNSLTIDRNRFLALVLKSPTQMGWLSIINSVTNISRLGTFNDSAFRDSTINDSAFNDSTLNDSTLSNCIPHLYLGGQVRRASCPHFGPRPPVHLFPFGRASPSCWEYSMCRPPPTIHNPTGWWRGHMVS